MPTPRPVTEIDRDTLAMAAAIKRLHAERRAAVTARRQAICRAFDAGDDLPAIATRHGMTIAATRSVLWQEGRTQRGRRAVRQQIHQAMCEAPAP